MTTSPEQSRINGKKSKGPVTERGKAIASKNATKHGLLAEKPPLLATEDLDSFKNLMRGLVEQYSPKNPVQWHLVQQVAMAMLRQHRLWQAEAALATSDMESEPSLKLPYPEYQANDVELQQKSQYHQENIRYQIEHLERLIELLTEEDFSEVEAWQDEFNRIVKKLGDCDYNPVRIFDFEHYRLRGDNTEAFLKKREKFFIELRETEDGNYWATIEQADVILSALLEMEKKYSPEYHLHKVFKAATERLTHLKEVESANSQAIAEHREQLAEYQQAIAPAKGVSDKTMLFARYEKHINNQLNQALEKLEASTNKGFLGSFRKN